jgi:hypothetical protein
MENIQQEKEFLQTTQAALKAETEEIAQVSTRMNDNLVKAVRLMWRQLFVIWVVVIVLVISYVFILHRTPSTKEGVIPTQKALEKPSVNPKATVSSYASPSQQSSIPTPMPEAEHLLPVLEQVREAQLKKDITLFLQAYSPTFPDLTDKKAKILRTWQKYDYLNMQCTLKNIQRKKEHTIIAEVVWDITLQDIRTKEKRTLKKDYAVHFSNSSGKWLIQELIQEKNPEVAATPIGQAVRQH